MNNRQLEYFVSVANHLNFTEAANEQYTTQSNISRQIADLEIELNAKLFDRTRHSVKLTPAGRVFYREAVSILVKTEEAIRKTRAALSGEVGSLNLGFISSASKNFLPEFVNGFVKKYPQIKMNLVQSDWEHINSCINNGDLDVGFTLDLDLRNAPGIQKEVLYTVPHVLVTRKDHPHFDRGGFSALSGEPLIYLDDNASPGGMEAIMRLCENRGFIPSHFCRVPMLETVIFYVESGLGFAILPNFAMEYCNKSILQFTPLTGADVWIDVIAVWKRDNINPSVPIMLNELRKFLKIYPISKDFVSGDK